MEAVCFEAILRTVPERLLEAHSVWVGMWGTVSVSVCDHQKESRSFGSKINFFSDLLHKFGDFVLQASLPSPRKLKCVHTYLCHRIVLRATGQGA